MSTQENHLVKSAHYADMTSTELQYDGGFNPSKMLLIGAGAVAAISVVTLASTFLIPMSMQALSTTMVQVGVIGFLASAAAAGVAAMDLGFSAAMGVDPNI